MNNLVEINNNEITIDSEFVEKYKIFKREQAVMELAERQLKEDIKEVMKELGKTTVISNGMSVSYVERKGATRIDSKRLKEELSDIYDEYSVVGKPTTSLTIKVDV